MAREREKSPGQISPLLEHHRTLVLQAIGIWWVKGKQAKLQLLIPWQSHTYVIQLYIIRIPLVLKFSISKHRKLTSYFFTEYSFSHSAQLCSLELPLTLFEIPDLSPHFKYVLIYGHSCAYSCTLCYA